MEYEIKKEGKFDYVEVGEGEPLMLLHGLFGALSNFSDLIEHFKHTHKVIVPILPLYDLDLLHTTVKGLAKHVQQFIDHKGYNQIHLLGNSLGGHVGLVHILNHPEKIKTLILTGSSGLFENAMGDSYPKRGDYEYIRAKTAETFYDPAVATKELVDEVFVQKYNTFVRDIRARLLLHSDDMFWEVFSQEGLESVGLSSQDNYRIVLKDLLQKLLPKHEINIDDFDDFGMLDKFKQLYW